MDPHNHMLSDPANSQGNVLSGAIRELPFDSIMLICYVRSARRKATDVATMEALCLLQGLGAAAMIGGPLSEVGGLFWLALPKGSLSACSKRLPHLGYTYAVDLVQPLQGTTSGSSGEADQDERLVRWRRKPYSLLRLYEEDSESLREKAPDRRPFLFEDADGTVREVRGYRGDSSPLGRRGLPVCDARMLVNVVLPPNAGGEGRLFLDPFAGAGGVVIEALAHKFEVVSTDADPALRHGLRRLGSQHSVANAQALPFESDSFDAVATEPPYDEDATPSVVTGLREISRVMRAGGCCAMLCAASQADRFRAQAVALGLIVYLDFSINRKGLDVTVLAWRKSYSQSDKDSGFAIWTRGFSRFLADESNRRKPRIQKII